jgi:hypothetical protein
MGRVYSAVFENVAVAAAQDFFELLAATGKPIAIHEITIADHDTDTDEKLRVRLVMGAGTVTSGSGGSTATPRPFNVSNAAAGATIEINNTTKMLVGTGALTTLKSDAFNTASGWFWVPTPECRPIIAPGDRMTVELVANPVATRNMSGCVVFEELA